MPRPLSTGHVWQSSFVQDPGTDIATTMKAVTSTGRPNFSKSDEGFLQRVIASCIEDRMTHHAELLLQDMTERLERHLSAIGQCLHQGKGSNVPDSTSYSSQSYIVRPASMPSEEADSMHFHAAPKPQTTNVHQVMSEEATSNFSGISPLPGSSAKSVFVSKHHHKGGVGNLPARAVTLDMKKEISMKVGWWEADFSNNLRAFRGSDPRLGFGFRSFLVHIFLRFVECFAIREPERQGCLANFVESKAFASVTAAVVAANAAFIVYSADRGIELLSPDASTFSVTAEWCFTAFYAVELSLRLWVHRLFFYWCQDVWWNILDTVLALFAIADQILSVMVSSVDGGINVTFLRSVRILKLAKVLRVARLIRLFDELRLMLNSVLGSLIPLLWSFVALGFCFCLFSLVFVQGTSEFLIHEGDRVDDETKGLLLEFFGSVRKAMLTVYAVSTSGMDWSDVYDVVALTGDMSSICFIFYVGFYQIALVNILTGRFVERALKIATPGLEVLALEQKRKDEADRLEMRRICAELDEDGNGEIEWAEFSALIQSPKLRAHLAQLGLDIKDAQDFFGLVAAHEPGGVSIDRFVEGCMHLKGNASSVDLQTLKYEMRVVHQRQEEFFQYVRSRLGTL